MKKLIVTSVMAYAACAASAFGSDFSGTIGIGGIGAEIRGDEAKFNEYRDINSGVTGNFAIDFARKGYYLEMMGENFGVNTDAGDSYDTQKYSINGGRFGSFKYNLFYDELPHNFTFGAKTLFSGVGSPALVAPVASNAAVATALAAYTNTFDYSLDRKKYGAGLEVSLNTPFFLSARFERSEVDGLYPLGSYNSTYGNAKELPAPIDYATNNLYLESGYRSKDLIFTLDGTVSNFTNRYEYFTYDFTNGSPVNVYQAPDSTYYKIGGSLTYRMPFWSTVLMARATHSESSNEIDLFEGISKKFEGEITYTTASVNLTSNPLKNLDTRLFVNYLDKQNDSTGEFAYGTISGNPAITEKFRYDKLNAGFDASYKLPGNTKLSGGYEYLKTARNIRTDAANTIDNIVFVQAKNNLLDWLTAKVRYQYLDRTSNYLDGELYGAATGDELILAYWRPADTADKRQHVVKVGVDMDPIHNLTFGLEYAFKTNDYDKTILGVTKDDRHQLYLDAMYAVSVFKFNPFFDFELVNVDSDHRRFNPGNADPAGLNDANNYNWTSKREDVNFAFGLNTDVDIIKDKLTGFLGYRYEKANGSEDFSSSVDPTTLSPALVSNSELDDYTKQTLTAKLGYRFTKNLKMDLTYLYENLDYSDDHYTGYTYVPASGTHFTGAYNDSNYEAHAGWVRLSYNF
uniref:MtrB/PioB family decaheme-associated outer membrane protein n=1 Tax=Geobacter metallireducens TaxID=28232 RepID=A0A831U2G5_GEOME